MRIILITLLISFSSVFVLHAQNNDENRTSSKNDAQLANKLYNESLKLATEDKYLEAISSLNKAIGLRPRLQPGILQPRSI